MPPQDIYLESQVLTAEPIELVRLLYRAAGDAVRSASAHLAAGRILERSQQVNKAYAILSELTVTLDPARGGTLSHSLAELYDYMQRRLVEANRLQQPELLAEVERLLATLQEGWDQIQTNPQESASHSSAASPERPVSPEREEEFTGYGEYSAVYAPAATGYASSQYASQSWSA